IAQSRRQIIEARRHVFRLADEKDLMGGVRLGRDERGDGSDRRRKERAVRGEAIGGSHLILILQGVSLVWSFGFIRSVDLAADLTRSAGRRRRGEGTRGHRA